MICCALATTSSAGVNSGGAGAYGCSTWLSAVPDDCTAGVFWTASFTLCAASTTSSVFASSCRYVSDEEGALKYGSVALLRRSL